MGLANNILLNIAYLQQTGSFFMYLRFNTLFRKEVFKFLPKFGHTGVVEDMRQAHEGASTLNTQNTMPQKQQRSFAIRQFTND
jgi:hypothetical protein